MVRHIVPRIFNVIRHSQVVVPAAALLMAFGPASAETKVAVLQDDFNCIMQNLEDYRAQGDLITLNFETCPERPTTREELRAHDARNYYPPRPIDNTATRTSSVNASVLMVSKQEFNCLLTHLELIEIDDVTGRLLILPDPCQVPKP